MLPSHYAGRLRFFDSRLRPAARAHNFGGMSERPREAPVPTILLGSSLWRQLDEPGFDICRLKSFDQGFLIHGRILTLLNADPAEVHYAVHCGPDWTTRHANVTILEASSARHLQMRRHEAGGWFQMRFTEREGERPERALDETRIDGLDGIRDIDLSATPATNTLAIRRLALDIGESRDADAVWVLFPELTIERLPQRYTRIDERRYRYESQGGAFVAVLEVDDAGLIVRYGDLWERVTS